MRVAEAFRLPLIRCVNRLNQIGGALSTVVLRIRQRRPAGAAVEAAPPAEDVERAWDLLGRTIRWARVLLMRISAELEAETTVLKAMIAAEQATDPTAAVSAAPEASEPAAARPRRARAPDPDRGIKRKTVAEIVEQICADMGAAATLLGETEAAREVAAIAAAMRALLNGAGDGVSAAVSPPGPGPGVSAAGSGPAMLPAAAGPLRAPDSG
jgi:hypothetical protein